MFATPNAISEGVSSKSPDRTSPIRNIRGSFKFKHGVLGGPIVSSPKQHMTDKNVDAIFESFRSSINGLNKGSPRQTGSS